MFSTPQQISFMLSLVISIITASLSSLLFFVDSQYFWKILVVETLLLFIVTFVISFYAIKQILFKKITPIYKIIQQTAEANEKIKLKFDNNEIINRTESDVSLWVKQKTKEIEKLKRLEKYRREFLGNVSHELKTPIFNIQGYISTLIDGGINDSNINIKYLEKADQSINRLITIVKDLEEISKLESGELAINKENFNIVQLVKEVCENLEERAKKQNIKFFINNSDKSISVNADRQRIQDVLNNLILNSLIYGKENGTTSISFFDMENKILVEVTDNGIGIDNKHLPRLFERFYRVDKSRSRDLGGTGLGLAIVKHIIERHNETIHVKSTVGIGSSFTFTLNKV